MPFLDPPTVLSGPHPQHCEHLDLFALSGFDLAFHFIWKLFVPAAPSSLCPALMPIRGAFLDDTALLQTE